MNKTISKIVTLTVVIFITFLAIFNLSSCSLDYNVDILDEYAIGYSTKNAFMGYVIYNLDTTKIYLPSEYKGVKVEELGEYYGRGVPTPFFLGYSDTTTGFTTDLDNISKNDTIIEVNINIYLPKYLKKCSYIQQYVSGFRENDYNIIYIAKCNYHIDSENEFFYTKNGKLFNKSDNTIVEKLIYQDE